MDLSSLSDKELMDLYNKKAPSKDLSSMSDEQLMALYGKMTPPKPVETKQPEPEKPEPGMFGRFGREFGRQTESLYSSGKTAYESLTDEDKQAVAKRSEERQKKIAEKYGPERGLAEVKKAYEEKGILPAAGEVLYQIPGAVGSLVPTMAGGIVGGIAGGIVGGPVGATIGGGLGAGVISGGTQLGTNLERQFEVQVQKGEAIDPDYGSAALGAAMQAGLDVAGFLVPFGKALIAPFSKIASRSGAAAAQKLAAESISKSLMRGTAVGLLAEVPTEVAQQMIERYQAGLDLFTDDALKEYADIAYKTAISVAPLGGPGRLIERGAAKADIAREKAKEEERAGLSEEQKQYLAQRGTEAEQAAIARQKQEQAEAEEAAKAAGMGYQPKLEAPPTVSDTGPAPAVNERTRAEQRGDNFMVVTEAGTPVQGGFQTMDQAREASDRFNSEFEKNEEKRKADEAQAEKERYTRLAGVVNNPAYAAIDMKQLSGRDSWISNAINRMRRANKDDERTVASTVTTPAEIAKLNIPDTKALSDRLLEEQYPGIRARGLTTPTLGATARGEAAINKYSSIESVPSRMNKELRAIAEENGIDVTPETKPIDVINELRGLSGKEALATPEEISGKNRPAVLQAQRDSITRQAREQQLAEEKAAKDWENSPVRPFSEAVDKQQNRVNNLQAELDKAKDKKAKAALEKRLEKAKTELETAKSKLDEANQKYGVTEGPYRPAEVIGQQKAEQQSKIKSAIKAAFDKLGLTKQGVKPEVVSYIADASGKPTKGAEAVAGEFDPATKTITLASDIYDPSLSVEELTSKIMDYVNHEVVHALKQAGLFTPKEWNILENYVKNGQGMKFLERAKIQYPELDMAGQIEEAIAEAAREFDAGNFNPVGAPRSMLKRIVDFFKGLFGAAKAANTTPDQIFNAIRTGEIGAREGTPQAGTKMQAKIGEAGTRNWNNQAFMLRTLGRNMYNKDIGNITAKELVQNSFDAIKSAQVQGKLIGPGKIVYDYNDKDKSITVTDNGTGMDEETIKSAFFTVFGTKKESLSPKDSSGGFGLAKLAYLLAAKNLKLESTKDGVTYSVHTNSDEVMHFYTTHSDIEVEKKNTPNKQNGTKVYIELPEEIIGKDGDVLKTNVTNPNIFAYNWRKIIGNVQIYRKEPYSWNEDKKIKLDKEITDLSEFRPPQTHKFSWGEVDLYIGNKIENDSSRPIVLSSGIYQFDIWDVKSKNGKGPRVKSIYNVKSYSTPAGLTMDEFEGNASKAKNVGYPFRKEREGFEDFVMEDIKKLNEIVLAESKTFEIAEEVKSMSSFYKMSPGDEGISGNFKFKSVSAPRTSGGINFEKIDVGVSDADIENGNFVGKKEKFPSDSVYFHTNLNKDLIEEASSNQKFNKTKAREFFYKLGKIYHDFAFVKLSAVADLDPKYETYRVENNARIVGVSLDKNYHGVNTVVPLTGMFINPFPVHEKLEGKIDSAGIAAEWGRIMLHEAAHEVARNHNSNFSSEEITLYSLIRQTERNNKKLPTLIDIEDRLEQLYNDYATEYEAMKNVYDNHDTENFSDSIGGNNEGVTELEERNRERRRESTGTDDYGSGGQEVSPVRQEGREVSGISNEEAEGINGQASNAPAISGEGKRNEVKQARVSFDGKSIRQLTADKLRMEQEQSKRENLLSNRFAMNSYAKDKGISTDEMRKLVSENYDNAKSYLKELDQYLSSDEASSRSNAEKMAASNIKFNDVKQARLAARVGPVNVSLNTPQQQSTSNEINRLLINNNKYLSKLTKEEGTRTSQRFMDYVKEVINPFHMLGAGANKYRIARALTVGNIAEMTRGVSKYVNSIANAKEDHKAIYKYLTTRGALPDQIRNADARVAAVAAKRIINDIGNELVRRGLLDPKERARFADEYLPRVYLAYIDNKKHVRGGLKPSYQYYLESREDLTEEQRNKLGEIDDPAFLVQEALFAPMRDIAILNFFDKINEVGQGQWIIGMEKFPYVNSAGQKVDRTLPDLKMFKHRLERMLSDGHVDPAKAGDVATELAHLTSFISKTENSLDANVDKGRYIKVPNDKSRFGPLAGVWMARPIYRDIMGMGSFIPNNMSEMAALFSDGGAMAAATRHFKIAKVAMNPPTVVTNIISNALMMHFADVPMARILPSVASVFKEIVLDKKGKYYDLVHKYGLKETTLTETELSRLYDELKKRQAGGSDLNKIMSLFNSLGNIYGKAEDRASDFYGSIETIFKAAIIKDAMERQINKDTKKHFTEEEAVLKANKYLFDYSEVHDAVKVLRNIPFGAPFLTWSYKMTPLLIETALTKPWKFAPYAMLYAGISALASSAMTDAGGDEEDKEKLRKYLSKKAAENPMLMVTDPTTAFDFGKYMPFNNMYKFAAALGKGNPVEALKAFGFLGGPAADIGVAIITQKDPFTGMDIYPKGSSYDQKVALSFNYFMNAFTPSFMKDMPRFIAGHGVDDVELIAGSESPVVNLLKEIMNDPTGKKPGMPTKNYGEIIANIFGFNVYHPSFTQYAKNLNSFNAEMTDIKIGRKNALSDPSLTEGERKAINEKYNRMIQDKVKELQEFVKNSTLSPEVARIVTESIENGKRSRS